MSIVYVLALVALVLCGCGTPASAQPSLQPEETPPGDSTVELAAVPTAHQEVVGVAFSVQQEPAPFWIANHTQTTFWEGPDAEAPPLGRLPVGSYFQVTGHGVGGRLPVAYLGNRTIPPGDGWVAVADVGPIPEPGADWSEPDFPPRRLVVGERGELIRGDPSLPLIALTFDAGADVGATVQLLDVLREKGVHSTFFIAGSYADHFPGVIARMAEDGHELANHSYSHPDFRNLSEAQQRTEIRRGTAAIEIAAGARIVPLWRPPFGSRNSQILRVVAEEGFRSVFWTFDSGDWIEGATVAGITATDLSRAVPGAVVVHHVSPLATARAIPTIIDELRHRGYELVTVTDIIGP